jgi:hypothetical protein
MSMSLSIRAAVERRMDEACKPQTLHSALVAPPGETP